MKAITIFLYNIVSFLWIPFKGQVDYNKNENNKSKV